MPPARQLKLRDEDIVWRSMLTLVWVNEICSAYMHVPATCRRAETVTIGE